MGGQEGSLLDVYGGEYFFDNLSVYLMQARGSDSGVTIEYGKNLTDITQEENIEKTYNTVLPFVLKTVEGENIVNVGSIIRLQPNAPARVLNLDLSDRFNDVEEITTSMIDQLAQEYVTLHNPNVPSVSIKVSFINLADTDEYRQIGDLEQVHLCDTVKVRFPKLGVDATAKVTKTVYDVLNERYESIELGDQSSGLANTISGLMNTVKVEGDKQKKYTQDAIERATALITGGLGGYVVMSMNSNGQPEEILIMDTPDKTTATNVIRMNLAGIGFSVQGYDGPFETAWTIDGSFVADFIQTGTLDAQNVNVVHLNASNITTGTLDAETINVEKLNASNLTRGTMDNARAGGETQADITVVNWNGQLCHFQWENGIGADYWLEASTYWKQIYEDAGGDYQRG